MCGNYFLCPLTCFSFLLDEQITYIGRWCSNFCRMNCELLATCSALGYLEGDTYHKEADCLGERLSWFPYSVCLCFITRKITVLLHDVFVSESIKDLIRYLRHEDDTRDVRQQLGAGQIVQHDLLHIITQYGQDKALFDACIRYTRLFP